jgi:hypothetical protein
MNFIPSRSEDCSHCYGCLPGGRHFLSAFPCRDHRDAQGNRAPYTGRDVYEPSEWVQKVVGKRYRAWNSEIYLCTGYDPRAGFWMRNVLDEGDLRNVSERAIGGTYHEVRV